MRLAMKFRGVNIGTIQFVFYLRNVLEIPQVFVGTHRQTQNTVGYKKICYFPLLSNSSLTVYVVFHYLRTD